MVFQRSAHAVGNVLLLGTAALLVVGPARADGQKPAKKNAGGLNVSIAAGKETTITSMAWKQLPRRKVTVKGRKGAKITYKGVALAEVLRDAKVPFDKHLRGPRVAQYVVVEGADGYRAVFALAEIDPSTSKQIILLADRKDGKSLTAADGPYRVIVPNDKIHSRWVKQVTKIALRSAAKE
jgi:DMSO/TMAO reductase YedYZ molybdopterin-dependent catalytic subunit